MASRKPTHLPPLTEAERAYVRPTDPKRWQGGPRFVTNPRAGLYKTRTGNSHGPAKSTKKIKGPANLAKSTPPPRETKRPHWARKYD